MRAFWKRDELGAVERELRAARPTPREDYVEQLVARAHATRPRQRRALSRTAFAAAVGTFILGTFGSFGGLGYAAAGASEATRAVTKMVTQQRVVHSAAKDQYGAPEKTVKTTVRKDTPGGGVASGLRQTGSGGSLPFTGISLAATAVLGLGLLGLGIMLRRWERSQT